MYFNFEKLLVLFLATLGCFADSNVPPGPAFCREVKPAMQKREVVANQYIASMTPGMTREVFDNTMKSIRNALGENDRLRETWFFSDFRGFSIEASPLVMDVIRAIPGIEEIHNNEMLYDHQQITQHNSVYGLDRISHRTNGLAQGRNYSFIYHDPAGQGTTVYVIDSGVYAQHTDFGGRVRKGHNYAPPSPDGKDAFEDYTGHGTHVASIAAGYDYGVAKRAGIVDVKIFNDKGHTTFEAEVSAISWAANDAEEAGRQTESVLNMSFGGPAGGGANIVNYAVRSAIRAGLLCVIAAGNRAENVGTFSPANVQEACTVGGTQDDDGMYVCSNFGDGIDIYAPGANITAAGIGDRYEVVQKYGTSMAAPYVAGVAAYLKGFKAGFDQLSPKAACDRLVSIGTKGYINFPDYAVPSGPNIIVYDEGNVY